LDVQGRSHVLKLAPEEHVFVPLEVNFFGEFFLSHFSQLMETP
jgi:hypothetical protein